MVMQQNNDPMHGVTLESLLNALVDHYGWASLAKEVKINCFKSDPSIKSSLKFLRRTPWARKEVETLYLNMLDEMSGNAPTAPEEGPWANWHKK